MNQARSLASLAFLAAQTPLSTQAWNSSPATISRWAVIPMRTAFDVADKVQGQILEQWGGGAGQIVALVFFLADREESNARVLGVEYYARIDVAHDAELREHARLASVNNLCLQLNLFHNEDFVFANGFEFPVGDALTDVRLVGAVRRTGRRVDWS